MKYISKDNCHKPLMKTNQTRISISKKPKVTLTVFHNCF